MINDYTVKIDMQDMGLFWQLTIKTLDDLRIVGNENNEPSTKNLIYRSLLGFVFNLAFGSNYLFIFFNKDKKSINDLLSKTKTIKIN